MTVTLTLETEDRERLWRKLVEHIEDYAETLDEQPVSRPVSAAEVRAEVAAFDFDRSLTPEVALDRVADLLLRTQVHTPHADYYGLFNPNPTTMGIAGDALAAAFNPQLAAWSHSPAACEIEQHVLREMGARFGYDPARLAGSFTSGGAEANHTAVLCALTTAFPEFGEEGVAAIVGKPVLYVTEESHHSFVKAARLCGLGTQAVRRVPVDEHFTMDPQALAAAIAVDRSAGHQPFLVVATLGTTNAGLIDPIDEIVEIAITENLWLHADAAWGGAAALVPDLRPHLGAIERADSITFDAHKWLSVPMGAGIFLTRHQHAPRRTFSIATDYMPVLGTEVIDPHLTTMQWSRRFIGLKVFLSLAVAGWEGYAEAISHQAEMGRLLRLRLIESGWQVLNKTPLPTLCWVDSAGADNSPERLDAICRHVVDSGHAWISTTRLAGRVPVLRATITNYRTDESNIERLIEALDRARTAQPREDS